MKSIKYAALLLVSAFSIQFYAMDQEADTTLESQLVNNIKDVYKINIDRDRQRVLVMRLINEYLRKREVDVTSPVWGPYADMIREIRTAECAGRDYRTCDNERSSELINLIVRLIAGFIGKRPTHIMLGPDEFGQGYISTLYELQYQIKVAIVEIYVMLRADMEDDFVVEGRST